MPPLVLIDPEEWRPFPHTQNGSSSRRGTARFLLFYPECPRTGSSQDKTLVESTRFPRSGVSAGKIQIKEIQEKRKRCLMS